MKKTFSLILLMLFSVVLISCNKDVFYEVKFIVEDEVIQTQEVKEGEFAKRPENPEKEDYEFDGWYKSETFTDGNRWIFSDEPVKENIKLYGRWINDETIDEYFKTTIELPSLSRLADATEADLKVVEDAPDLLILGIVVDTFYYFQNESMSGYEYIKVFNNTNEPYNLKDHRIVLADPLQGQNGETEEAQTGNRGLVTGFLFNAYIDEDVYIEPLSTVLLWMKPYYWTIGSGTGAYNKTFSADLIHTTMAGQKGAFEQTVEDFKNFYDIEDETKVIEVTNQPMIAIRPESGTEDFFPMISPGAGTPYSHLNATLLRSIEIQKLNPENENAKVEILNKYETLPEDKKENPDPVFGKIAFNVIHLTDEDETIDIYTDYEQAWKYFKPIVRAQIHGLVNETMLTDDNIGSVDLRRVESDSNPGIRKWENTVEIQFRPPVIGERVMQMQLPLREIRKMEKYLTKDVLKVIRIVENVTDYRWEQVEIYLSVDPEIEEVNWRRDEIKSPGRMNAAAPTKIKLINITRP